MKKEKERNDIKKLITFIESIRVSNPNFHLLLKPLQKATLAEGLLP